MLLRIFLVLLALLCTDSAYARSSFRPTALPHSCSQVRMAVKMFTIPHLKKMGDTMGVHLTGAQMREAQKCLQNAKP